jgi:hypothetical protein
MRIATKMLMRQMLAMNTKDDKNMGAKMGDILDMAV